MEEMNSISPSVLDSIERLLILSELDETPTKEELSKAISDISSGKAPGQDGIPAEVFKCGGSQLLGNLNQLLCKCWKVGSVPQEMRDSTITTLYKNKGDRSDRHNYRGISPLCIAGKLFARVALYRLQKLAERVYPESPMWFLLKSVGCIHNFFTEATSGEVQRATTAPLHCFAYRSNKGV